MKKEEFITYLEGMSRAFEAANVQNMVELIDSIILEADTIEVVVNNYPYNVWPYINLQPWQPWYNSTASDVMGGVTTTMTAVTELLEDVPQWEVKITGPKEMDWEINKCG